MKTKEEAFAKGGIVKGCEPIRISVNREKKTRNKR